MKKKLISILLTLALIVSLTAVFAVPASADQLASGKIGDTISWKIINWNTSNGYILFVGGSGEIPAFSMHGAPWYQYGDNFVKIIVEEGITYIGKNAFRDLDGVKTVQINRGVWGVGDDAFYDCDGLETVIIDEGLSVLGFEAFSECDEIKTLVLPSTLHSIYEDAFEDSDELETVWYAGIDWNNVAITSTGNEDLIDFVNSKGINGLDKILDKSKLFTDRNYHWYESKSDYYYHVVGPKTEHYDNNGNGICDGTDCWEGVWDKSRSLQYIDENGRSRKVDSDVRYLTGYEKELVGGWYTMTNRSIDYGNTRLRISGDVKIVLKDGYGLTLKKGIEIPSGSMLTIYSQSISHDENNNMGYIKVTEPDTYNAGIGTGRDVSGGTAVFYGGRIEANGGTYGAGIGSGYSSTLTVDIHDGYIKAQGGSHGGAGIGSGYGQGANCTVTIDGGYVEARGGVDAAGIGSGEYADATVNISGGIIKAWGLRMGAGIGAGSCCWMGSGVHVNLSGNPKIEAHGGECDPSDTITHITKMPDIGAGLDSRCTVTDTRGGFTLSGGNWWIIAIGAVVILGGLAAIIIAIAKNKKKGNAEGEPETENTETAEEETMADTEKTEE